MSPAAASAPPRLAGTPPAAALARDGWLQLPLFADVPRAYRYGRTDLRTDAVPGNPWLARALHIARTTAEARGWDPQMLGTLNRTLTMVLAGYAEGTVIKVSEFRPALRQRGDSITRTAQILDAMGILADDRPAAFDQWLAARLGGLAPAISGETSGGPAPCTTAPRAPRPCTTRPSGPTSPRSARHCWNGRPAMRTCARSPPAMSAPPPRSCTARGVR